VMIAGVSYASSATERAAMAEANAARAQLAALRSHLHPHFLFNTLHTVVHLIPREPTRAADAAVELAGLLRTTIEEDRDLVPLDDEVAFIERYLAIERIRFGDRLRIETELSPEARRTLVPSFAVQTLVENAVRHGATPRVEPTTIRISGSLSRVTLTVSVRDDGAGATADQLNASARGTGLTRLRERLAVLYRGAASLAVEAHADGPARGVRVTLIVPADHDDL
jgi:LytS/YehU family sensor histidine kinase